MAYPNIDPTTIFHDAFTEASADTELSSHTPDTGTGWSLIFRDDSADKINAVASSDSAKPNASQANRGVIYSANGTYPSADYEASVKIVAGFTGTNRGYLIVRMTDQENMYALRFSTGATATRLYKKVSGTWTALGSFKTDPAVGGIVKIRVCGNVLQYFYNDVLIDQQTDSALTSAGKAGLGMGGGAELASSTDDILNTSELDDFLVQTVERTHTFFSSLATSMSVNLPGGIQAGDLLIAVVEDRNAPSYTKPTGWSDLFTQAGGGSVGQLRGFYKIADGTESGQVTFTAGATTTAIWVSFRIKNFHGTQAPEAATASGDSTNADSPSLSPSWGSEPTLFLSIAGHAAASAAAFSAGPSGYSDFLCKGASSGGSAVSIASADKKVTAASENPGNFTASGSNRWWAAATIAIRTLNTTPTSVSVSDTASGDDTTQSIHNSIVSAENTSGSDVLSSLVAGIPLTDTSSGTDGISALLAAIAQQETASASDALSLVATTPLTDSGVATDTTLERALVQQIESGSATEIDVVSVVLSTIADTLSGVDAATLVSVISEMDNFSGSDIVNVVGSANQISVSESGSGSELLGILAICRILEDCAGAENLNTLVNTQVVDVSGGSDSIFQSAIVPTVDTATGADIARVVASMNIIDFASGYEVLSLAVAISQTDPCVAVDTVAILNRFAMLDSAIGNEHEYIAGQILLSETGGGDDIAQLITYIFSSDSAEGAENIVKIWRKIYTRVSGRYDTITGKYTKISSPYSPKI